MEISEPELMRKLMDDSVDYLKTAFSASFCGKFKFSSQIPNTQQVIQDNPPIHCVAAYFGSINCLRHIIEDGTDLTLADDKHRTIQYFAVAGGNLNVVHYLATRGLNFQECTHLAAALGNINILKYLLRDLKLDPLTVDGFGDTLLHSAAIGGDVETAEFLISLKVFDINCRDHDENTALHLAAIHGNLGVAKALVKAPGIDLNPTNSKVILVFFKFFL